MEPEKNTREEQPTVMDEAKNEAPKNEAPKVELIDLTDPEKRQNPDQLKAMFATVCCC
jgi:hypothetical protein